MEGLPLNAFGKAAQDAGMGIRDYAAPKGESWKDVNVRARDFIQNDIIKNYMLTPENIKNGAEEEKVQSFN